jgi:hypothetical protein
VSYRPGVQADTQRDSQREPWGWRQRARDPRLPSSAFTGAFLGGAGVALSGVPWPVVLLLGGVFAVLPPVLLLFTLPPWPSWKEQGPSSFALLMPVVSLGVLLVAILIRVAT